MPVVFLLYFGVVLDLFLLSRQFISDASLLCIFDVFLLCVVLHVLCMCCVFLLHV